MRHFRSEGTQPYHAAIQPYIKELATEQPDHHYSNDTSPGSAERLTSVADTVLIIIGVSYPSVSNMVQPTRGNGIRPVSVRTYPIWRPPPTNRRIHMAARVTCTADQSLASGKRSSAFASTQICSNRTASQPVVLHASKLSSLAGVRIVRGDKALGSPTVLES
ncbi:hypothetical protein PG994_014564 [Apiospora phragmitis]|uniref:Uncharacterized protein n=1 Tax=Apiospora phragmitis TaxID=2905665 RepID=A0ABR1T545_9PEZI